MTRTALAAIVLALATPAAAQIQPGPNLFHGVPLTFRFRPPIPAAILYGLVPPPPLARSIAIQPPAAQPLQPFLVNHNNSIMLVRPLPGSGNEVVIEYAKPKPSLYGLVWPGTTLVRGRWVGPNDFIGTAWVFSRLCGPMPYAVRGGLDRP